MMQLQGALSIESMCSLARVSRASFYRYLAETAPREEQVEVVSAIHDIVASHRRRYGYRRVTAELRARGMSVNHKRVARLMREDNLLAIQRRKFIATTDSDHELQVYLNLAARMEITAVNQLWVADLTYVRLGTEFVYVAVVLDAFSRRVVGWFADRTLQAGLALTALERAIADRRPLPGLVHHSDRGVQYASHLYVKVLKNNGIVPSMSRPGNPYDNAMCESFMKTLKKEEVYCTRYADLEQLRSNMGDFIERYYNCCRLHSALDYLSPDAYEKREALSEDSLLAAAPKMSFFRHQEIYQSDAAITANPHGETGRAG